MPCLLIFVYTKPNRTCLNLVIMWTVTITVTLGSTACLLENHIKMRFIKEPASGTNLLAALQPSNYAVIIIFSFWSGDMNDGFGDAKHSTIIWDDVTNDSVWTGHPSPPPQIKYLFNLFKNIKTKFHTLVAVVFCSSCVLCLFTAFRCSSSIIQDLI